MPHRSPGVGGKSSRTMRSTATASGISTSTGCSGSGAGLACTEGERAPWPSSRRWTSSAAPGAGRPREARRRALRGVRPAGRARAAGARRRLGTGRLALAGLEVDDGDPARRRPARRGPSSRAAGRRGRPTRIVVLNRTSVPTTSRPSAPLALRASAGTGPRAARACSRWLSDCQRASKASWFQTRSTRTIERVDVGGELPAATGRRARAPRIRSPAPRRGPSCRRPRGRGTTAAGTRRPGERGRGERQRPIRRVQRGRRTG